MAPAAGIWVIRLRGVSRAPAGGGGPAASRRPWPELTLAEITRGDSVWRGGGGGGGAHPRAGGAQVKGKGWLPTFWVAGLRRGPRHVQSCPDLLALLGSGGAEPAAAAPVPTAEAGGGAAKAKVSAVGVLPRSASTHGLTADDAAATEEAQIRRRAAATYFRPPSARPPAVPPSSPRRREALGGRGSWRTQKSLILRL